MYTAGQETPFSPTFELYPHGPLGESIVLQAEGLPFPQSNLEVGEQLESLRTALEQIALSTHPDDQATVRAINYNFGEKHSLYLPGRLGSPMGGERFNWLLGQSNRSASLSSMEPRALQHAYAAP